MQAPSHSLGYNAALRALSPAGRWESALGVVAAMEAQGVAPTVHTAYAVAKVCERGRAFVRVAAKDESFRCAHFRRHARKARREFKRLGFG